MSIELVQQGDYNVNLQYVLEQYKDSEKMQAMIVAFNDEMSKVENAVFELRDNFFLTTAEGVQLDTIGSIFGEERRGRNDTEYRAAIAVTGTSFYSGTPEDIYAQVKLLFGATLVEYHDSTSMEPASFILISDGNYTKADLDRMSPAGVSAYAGKYLIQEDPQGFYLQTESGKNLIVLLGV